MPCQPVSDFRKSESCAGNGSSNWSPKLYPKPLENYLVFHRLFDLANRAVFALGQIGKLGVPLLIEALRSDVASQQEATASLEADAFAIERAIRERLEYAKPGETLVRLGDPRSLSYRIH